MEGGAEEALPEAAPGDGCGGNNVVVDGECRRSGGRRAGERGATGRPVDERVNHAWCRRRRRDLPK